MVEMLKMNFDIGIIGIYIIRIMNIFIVYFKYQFYAAFFP